MARTMNQQEGNNAAGNNNPVIQTGNDIVAQFESSSAWRVAKEGLCEGGDLLRNLTEKQLREMIPNSTMVSSMGRLFEEEQGEMTNYIISHMSYVIRHVVVNVVNDILSSAISSNQLLQGIFAKPRYVPSPPLYNNRGQSSQPLARILQRHESSNQGQNKQNEVD